MAEDIIIWWLNPKNVPSDSCYQDQEENLDG